MFSTEETRATAQKVLDYIHEYPEVHDQSNFFGTQTDSGCGTTMCIAGTAAFVENDYNVTEARRAAYGNGLSIETYAGQLLGLETFQEHDALFYEMDNERAIQKLKKIIVGEAFSDDDYWTVDDGSDTGRLLNVSTNEYREVDSSTV